jgi:glutaminyl-tRNA synthetase
VIDLVRLENAVRDHLNKAAERRMAVLRPLRVVIENYPEGRTEEMELVNNPEDPSAGTRMVPFSRELLIEREDFMEDPPKKFFRLGPGREVRLRGAYWVRCEGYETDPETGEVTLLRCAYDPETRGGESPPDGRKVKGTLHWVSAEHGVNAEVRLFDRLWKVENPSKAPEGGDVFDNLNPDSLETLTGCVLEPSLAEAREGDRFQFERLGYFCVDPDSAPGRPVFNRTVSLKDSWAKKAGKK